MSDPHLHAALPPKQGLYDPRFEHDACGVGFVVNVKGQKSNAIMRQAETVLLNLSHRGARGAEPNTGDGAGMLFQIPHRFLQAVCAELGIDLPAAGEYGVGMVFLPADPAQRALCEKTLEQIIREEGQVLLGWRTVPIDGSGLGATARLREPVVRQVFIGRNPAALVSTDDLAFERKLYVIRRRAENAATQPGWQGGSPFYFPSLSSRTIVYKGMLLSEQVVGAGSADQRVDNATADGAGSPRPYYPDLADPRVESALVLVHSRFSTNTFPSWERAHPYRYIIHNGEINTLRGNVNWMHARQSVFASALFGDDLKKILPVIDQSGSDSAMFDNCLEFLHLTGRSLAHAAMMMIPEPWSGHETMDDPRKAFYQYHAALMEPWDGPACISFTDGTVVGAVLDRNGLRPARYYVTSDDLVVLASEVGVLDVPPENVVRKGRLEPGRMFLIDTAEGRIISDEELKSRMAGEHPYREWLDRYLVNLEDLPEPPTVDQLVADGERGHAAGALTVILPGAPLPSHEAIVRQQQAFGYTFETLRVVMGPMAKSGVEALGSMGNDTPLAVLSDQPQLLYNYFKQLFAQVTNPPIDALREELVTSTEVLLGTELNLLDTQPQHCHQLRLRTPILSNKELAKMRYISVPGFKARTLPILFRLADGAAGLARALDDLNAAARQALAEGVNVLILSDRGVLADREMAPIPALLAVSGLHHYLIREELRTQAALVLESAEPREVHHFALLIGYGATAINPYLAFDTIADMIREGMLPDVESKKAEANYTKAVVKGVLKVLSKMGISTMQSYCGAQIFEAIGLSQPLVDRYFTWTPSRIGGIGLDEIFQEVQMRHKVAFPARTVNGNGKTLAEGGDYQWRADGERHVLDPDTVHTLQKACRTGDYAAYRQYAELINTQDTGHSTLRGLLEFKFAAEPLALDEVEPVESIVRRFKTGAMSYGSISQEAHETLAIAMNRLGGRSNTGEGGEDPARFVPDANGDMRSSAIKQVASGRFGVTSNYLVNARELQIKMAQGAKPGEGGQLPGRKVYPWIAKVRHSTPGVGLISPPPHHDIYSIEDLAELIHDLKNANRRARINVKLVSEVGVGTIAAGVAKGHADVILISGHDGGTGASPQTSIKHAGLPWELGLAETHQTLVLNNLRSRVVLETDGQLRTGRDVAIAALLGAEEYGFGTIALVTLGCVVMRVCHLDTCPVGVATQNPELRKNFTGDPEHLVNYMRFVAQDLRELMAMLGFRTVDQMIGRTDKLEPKQTIEHWKARDLDFANILYQPDMPESVGRYCQVEQDHGLDGALDVQVLLDVCEPALARGEPVRAQLPIRNVNRVVGTILGSELTRRYGEAGLPDDTIHLKFTGSAGQSFGAFVPAGITLELEGDANDYCGKGLSGGHMIVYPPEGSTFAAEENVIIGNVAFYGATGGEAYVRGLAGERFCVRNSGVRAVVEGVGDHGCEYMTGGQVVVLGRTGRNFAAGMSGGIAYVLDQEGDFAVRCNRAMVDLERLDGMAPAEIAEVKAMVQRHAELTGSALAWRVLLRWDELVEHFVKVMPQDYKRMLEAFAEMEAAGLSGDEGVMAAFELNKNDQARVSGN